MQLEWSPCYNWGVSGKQLHQIEEADGASAYRGHSKDEHESCSKIDVMWEVKSKEGEGLNHHWHHEDPSSAIDVGESGDEEGRDSPAKENTRTD